MRRLRRTICRINRRSGGRGDVIQSKYQYRKKIQVIVNVPKTYYYGANLVDIRNAILKLDKFVMKPNHLSRGIGIRVLEKVGSKYHDLNGDILTVDDLIDECAILIKLKRYKGIKAIILEEKIGSHASFKSYCSGPGMSDIRCIYYRNRFMFGVARFPTKSSGGYGNIIRGAAFGFFLSGGRFINSGYFQISTIKKGILPNFKNLNSAGIAVSQLFSCDFISVDMTVGVDGKVYVIESERLPQIEYYLTDKGVRWMLKSLRQRRKIPRHIKSYVQNAMFGRR